MLLDLHTSRFPFLDRFKDRTMGYIPVSNLQDLEELVGVIEGGANFNTDFERRYQEVASGAYYWYSFLKGYLEFANKEITSIDNVFLKDIRDMLDRNDFDANLRKILEQDGPACSRITQRFLALDQILKKDSKELHPISIFPSDTPAGLKLEIKGADPIYAKKIDGYHRIFSLYVCGEKYANCELA